MPDPTLWDLLNSDIDALLAGRPAQESGAELAGLAARLCMTPDENFKKRLKSDLERKAREMQATATAPVREGFRTITPYITVAEGDRLVEFLKTAYHAEETVRHSPAPGRFHAEVKIGDSMLMIGSGPVARGEEKPTIVHLYVDDCDAAYARAMAAGATSLGAPQDHFYGERSGYVRDVAGNIWYIATRFASAQRPEGASSIMPFVHPVKSRPYIDFLKRAFGATEMAVYEDNGAVAHAAVRIGDAILEMGDAHDESQRLPSAFFMYVPDVDAVFEQAVAAGATPLRAPVNQPYGHRDAALLDPAGYTWYPATLL